MSVYLYEEDKIQIKLYYYFLRADGKSAIQNVSGLRRLHTKMTTI